jgi:hypothetical protein
MLHLIGAFVGIERLGIREEARNVVVDEDAVAPKRYRTKGPILRVILTGAVLSGN